MTTEQEIENRLIQKLEKLKYTYRPDIRDRASLEQNFRDQFQSLNRVALTDGEFVRLREQITTAKVFAASKTLRERNTFQREDGTPLHYNWSILPTGVRTILSLSINCASTPTTVIIATTLSC